MNFLIRKLFKNVIPPEDESDYLIKIISKSAFQVFRDKRFRQLVDFNKQSEEEQNRIFNELVVTALIFLMLLLDDNIPKFKPERKSFWQKVREKIPKAYTGWMTSLGIEKKYVDIWEKLINLRLREYKREQKETRYVFLEEFLEKRDNEELQDAAVRLETLTVGSMLHITRGKAKPDDPLRRHLRTWLSTLNYKLERKVGW